MKFKEGRRLLCFTLVLVMVSVSMFTGCGKKQDTQNEQGSTEKTKILKYYGFSDWMGDPKIAVVYDEVVKEFEKENPGFKVELSHDPWGTWSQKYKVMFASGSAADVFLVNNPDFPVFANGNNLLALENYVDSNYFDDFFPGVLSMYKWKGSNMAIPFTTDCRVLWYNKEIFKQAGLDPEKPPTTWDELKEYAEKCTMDTDGDGKVDVYGFGMDLGLNEFPMQAIFTASNGEVINVSNDGAITPNVNTEEFKNYLELLTGMKDYYEPDFVTLDHKQVGTLFAQQKVAMAVAGMWIWDANENMETAEFYGQSVVPKMDKNAPEGSYGGGFGIAVSSNTNYPEEAVKFAQMLTDAKYNARLMTDIPASNAAFAESAVSKDEKYSAFVKQIVSARQAQPKTLYFPQIDMLIHDVVSEVILGKWSVDEGIEKLEKDIEEITKGQ